MSKLADIKAQIVKELVRFIQADTEPWANPWITPPCQPINAVSGRPYHGVNLIYLTLQQLKMKTKDPRWLTFLQAKEQGWKIKKGAKGVPIVFYTIREKELILNFNKDTVTQEDIWLHPAIQELSKKHRRESFEFELIGNNQVKVTVTYPILVYHYVFHASQVEGIPEYKPRLYNFNPIPTYEKLLNKTPNAPKIDIAMRDEASYAPIADTVYLPLKEQFKTNLDFYATLLHELCHSTMHEKRLNRWSGDYQQLNQMENYAIEELIAELGAFMVSLKVGLPFQPNQTYAYVKSWLRRAKLDFKTLWKVTSQAEKAADWIISEYQLEKLEEISIVKSDFQSKEIQLEETMAQ